MNIKRRASALRLAQNAIAIYRLREETNELQDIQSQMTNLFHLVHELGGDIEQIVIAAHAVYEEELIAPEEVTS